MDGKLADDEPRDLERERGAAGAGEGVGGHGPPLASHSTATCATTPHELTRGQDT